MRFCKSCGQTKPLEDFVKNKSKKLGHGYKCKSCSREYQNKHYTAHESRRKSIREAASKNKRRNKLFVRRFLENSACVDCGETDADVLEFDHIDQLNKIEAVSKLIQGSYSIEFIEKEISKCDVRCCNCHRKRTIKQFGWNAFLEKA